MKNILAVLVAGLVVAGCAKDPVSHHAVRHEVPNVEAGVDATVRVLNRHFNNKVKGTKKKGDNTVVTTDYETFTEMDQYSRRYCEATIIPTSDIEVEVDVVVLQQVDTSDTGYGERSPSNPQWGAETHDQDMERRILEDIRVEFEKWKKNER